MNLIKCEHCNLSWPEATHPEKECIPYLQEMLREGIQEAMCQYIDEPQESCECSVCVWVRNVKGTLRD